MAYPAGIGHDGCGPVAESVDARAVHCSLSWFKSRPGLHASPLTGYAWRSHARPSGRSVSGEARRAKTDRRETARVAQPIPEMPVDWPPKSLSQLRNLV